MLISIFVVWVHSLLRPVPTHSSFIVHVCRMIGVGCGSNGTLSRRVLPVRSAIHVVSIHWIYRFHDRRPSSQRRSRIVSRIESSRSADKVVGVDLSHRGVRLRVIIASYKSFHFESIFDPMSVSSPQVPVTRVPEQTQEEQDCGDTKHGNLDYANDRSDNRIDLEGRDEGDQQTESDQTDQRQERSEPVTLAVFVRSTSDQRDEDNKLHDEITDDLSPSSRRSKGNEGRTSDHGKYQGCEPEEVESLTVRPVEDSDRVEIPV